MRTGRDRFGEVAIAQGALYGVQTARCLENLSCSSFKLSSYPGLIRALARVKKAAAKSNCEAGIVLPIACQMICRACDEIIAGAHDGQFPVDMLHGGGSIAFNQNINEVVAGLAALFATDGQETAEGSPMPRVRAKEDVNASQSTADACSTAFRLALIEAGEPLEEILEQCAATLVARGDECAGVTTVARTCLQDAMPVPASSMFFAWAQALRRARQRVCRSLDALHSVNLGGTVIGSGDGACKAYRRSIVPNLCQEIGRRIQWRECLYDAAQNIDDIGELSQALALLAEVLIKICSDLRLLSSGPTNGFGELTLPSVQDGSSFFTNKNNPVVPETMLQACFHVLGNDRAAQAAVEHGELNLNVFESGAFFHTYDSLELLTSALLLLKEKCLDGIAVNVGRCEEMVVRHKGGKGPQPEVQGGKRSK